MRIINKIKTSQMKKRKNKSLTKESFFGMKDYECVYWACALYVAFLFQIFVLLAKMRLCIKKEINCKNLREYKLIERYILMAVIMYLFLFYLF